MCTSASQSIMRSMFRFLHLVVALAALFVAGCVTAVDETLPHDALPAIAVATEVELLASPAHPTSYLPMSPLQSGTSASVVAVDKDAAWLLLLHENVLGWMPTIFSSTNIASLTPALTIEPLTERCTKYLGTTDTLDQVWTSSRDGDLIIQGSIYRPQARDAFADVALSVTVDGSGTVAAGDYVHTPLTDAAAIVLFTFALDDVTKDSSIRFDLASAGSEPLFFQAAYFTNECADELNVEQRAFAEQLPVGTLRLEAKQLVQREDDTTPAHPDAITVTNGGSGSGEARGSVVALAWSPDGQYLASGSTQGVIAVWRLEDGEQLYTLEDHDDAITALAWAPDSQHLASSSADGTVRVWQMEDGSARYTFDSPKPTKIAEATDTVQTGEGTIPFSAPGSPNTLNPVFGWQPGSSSASTYDLALNAGALTIISGPKTDQWSDTDSGPLVTYPQTGNFAAQVKVGFSPEGSRYKVAGIGIRAVQDHKNWLRITRILEGSQVVRVQGGRGLSLNETPYVGDETFFRVERRGPLFTLSYSTNGVNWIPLQKDHVFEMPDEVEIYLIVYSTSGEGALAQFSEFEVTPK